MLPCDDNINLIPAALRFSNNIFGIINYFQTSFQMEESLKMNLSACGM